MSWKDHDQYVINNMSSGINIDCEFCNAIHNQNKIYWNVRSIMADDNICEFVNDKNCEHCDDCNSKFSLRGYQIANNTYISIDYRHEIKSMNGESVIINPFSEGVQVNFCPVCGKQLSQDVKKIDFSNSYVMKITDEY